MFCLAPAQETSQKMAFANARLAPQQCSHAAAIATGFLSQRLELDEFRRMDIRDIHIIRAETGDAVVNERIGREQSGEERLQLLGERIEGSCHCCISD